MESRLSDIVCSGFAGQIYDSKVCWQFLNLRRLNLRNVYKIIGFLINVEEKLLSGKC